MENSYAGVSSTMKHDRRWKSKPLPSSRASLVMAFFSCVAWLYVAGRLWQDAENRMLLTKLLEKSSRKLPKVLSVEDKLTIFGCKDLERRLVEAEMDLTLAKSRGFLRNQIRQNENVSRPGQKLLAVIGVYTGFGGHLKRNEFRASWFPTGMTEQPLVKSGSGYYVIATLGSCKSGCLAFCGKALRKLEERGVLLRFVIGRSANRGDSLDRHIDEENRSTKDFLILESHEEAAEELPKKAKFFFSMAVDTWDAEFYVKVDDGIKIDLDGLVEILKNRQGQSNVYMGCMKSGEVVSEEGRLWYEPDWWKFGDEKTYFRHAAGSLLVLSKPLAQYISINSGSLRTYAHDDISVGSWMMGVDATYVDESRLCCSSSRQDKACSSA